MTGCRCSKPRCENPRAENNLMNSASYSRGGALGSQVTEKMAN